MHPSSTGRVPRPLARQIRKVSRFEIRTPDQVLAMLLKLGLDRYSRERSLLLPGPKGRKMKRLALAALLTLQAACTSLSPAGEKVRVTSNPEAVKGCQLLGPVKGSSGWGGPGAGAAGENNSMNALRENAAEMGADTVLMVSSGTSSKTGEAYRCPK